MVVVVGWRDVEEKMMNLPMDEARGSPCPLRDYVLQIKILQRGVVADPAQAGAEGGIALGTEFRD